MEKNLYLYNGKDYWLIPRPKQKEVIMINIQTKTQRKIPFITSKAVTDNYECWLENSEVRLPRTFLIKSKNYNTAMVKTLKELGIKKERKSDLRTYLFYHLFETTWTCSHIDEITGTIIPTLDLKDFKEILAKKKQLSQVVQERMTRGMGLLSNEH
ncbi:MAG: hypothetical protein AB7E09_05605 [Candidatus Izemoplasmatales bacterium]